MAAQYAYVMKGMTKTFPGAPKPVLNNINLQFYQGAKIGIVGPNGAGKSTLLAVASGDLVPAEGRVRLPEVPVLSEHLSRVLPARVLQDVLAADLPLPSQEGFVRQILGWREFVRHVHEATDGLRRVGERVDEAEAVALELEGPGFPAQPVHGHLGQGK